MHDIQPLIHHRLVKDGHFYRYGAKEWIVMPDEDSGTIVRLIGGNDNQDETTITVAHRVCNERKCTGTGVSHLHGNERPYSPYSVYTQ